MSWRRCILCIMRALFLLLVPASILTAQQTQPAKSDKPQTQSQSQPGSGGAKPDEAKPQEIEQQQPAFYVHAEPDRPSRTYYEGEQMTVKVKSEADAYLYVIYEQADGATYVVFPNSGQPENRVKAKQEVEIPGKDDTFRWTIGAPFGNELMKVIASKERIPELEKPDVRQKRFTPITGKGLRNVIKQLGGAAPAEGFSEVTLKITTHAGVNPNSPHYGKRYAVLFGVAEQWVTEPTEKVFEKAPASNLGAGPVFDVALMGRCLRARGGIDQSWSCVGDWIKVDGKETPWPTKQNIKAFLTEVLPSLTQPGDTVLIYFSGHGSHMPDPREKDGFCEFLVPSDMVDAMGLVALRKIDREASQEGKSLPENLKEILVRAEGWLHDAQITFEPGGEAWQQMTESARNELAGKVDDVLLKKSAITDEEFGHWVQALDGRRVVVVFDACMSGGFVEEQGDQPKDSAPAKSLLLPPPRRPRTFRFDFLNSQLGRLKDLGQGNTAMLAAARPAESSLQTSLFPEQEPAFAWRAEVVQKLTNSEQAATKGTVGVFTFYLTNTLVKATGTVDVRQAGEACEKALQEYFRWRAEKTGDRDVHAHSPVFFDHSRPSILLKP